MRLVTNRSADGRAQHWHLTDPRREGAGALKLSWKELFYGKSCNFGEEAGTREDPADARPRAGGVEGHLLKDKCGQAVKGGPCQVDGGGQHRGEGERGVHMMAGAAELRAPCCKGREATSL